MHDECKRSTIRLPRVLCKISAVQRACICMQTTTVCVQQENETETRLRFCGNLQNPWISRVFSTIYSHLGLY